MDEYYMHHIGGFVPSIKDSKCTCKTKIVLCCHQMSTIFSFVSSKSFQNITTKRNMRKVIVLQAIVLLLVFLTDNGVAQQTCERPMDCDACLDRYGCFFCEGNLLVVPSLALIGNELITKE